MIIRRTLHASAFAAVAVAGFFAPEAAAYVSAPAPIPTSRAVPERAAYIKPTPATDAATVRILLEESSGSGVSIGNGFILTAAHVLGDAKEVKLKARDGVETTADVLWANRVYDIALLRSPLKIPAADLSCRTAHVGDTITAIGNPLGLEFISTSGKIAGEARQFGGMWKSAFVTDLTVIMGNSGGPVFDDYGKVIGIVVGVLGLPTGGEGKSYLGLSTVVPSSVVCSLLGRA